MSQPVFEGGGKKNFTGTGTIAPSASGEGTGILVGVFVSQASASPTLKIADAATTIANTFTPIPGTFYPMPCAFNGTLTVTIGGTVDCTVFWTNA